MASESEVARQESAIALALFREGRTKAEIAHALGKERKAVSKLIAQAIREQGNGLH